MIEERVAKLEAASERHSAAIAALESKMHNRANHLDGERSDQLLQQRITELREDTNRRFDEQRELINQRFADTDRRFQEQRELINQRFADTDRRFQEHREYTSQRLDQIDRRFDRVENSIDNLRTELQFFTRWMIGSQITVALAIVALAAKTFLG